VGRRVVAAVVEHNGRFLVCQRPLQKRHGGLWEFPGGKLEDGEDLAQAARRELAEELALEVLEVGGVRYSLSDAGSVFTIEFVDVRVSGVPNPFEHLQVEWCTPAELLEMPLAPSDRRFAERLAGAP